MLKLVIAMALAFSWVANAASRLDPWLKGYEATQSKAVTDIRRDKLEGFLRRWQTQAPFANGSGFIAESPSEMDLAQVVSLLDQGVHEHLSPEERTQLSASLAKHGRELLKLLGEEKQTNEKVDIREKPGLVQPEIPLKRFKGVKSEYSKAVFDDKNHRVIVHDEEGFRVYDSKTARFLFEVRSAEKGYTPALLAEKGWLLGGIRKTGGVLARWRGPGLIRDTITIRGLEKYEITRLLPTPDGSAMVAFLSKNSLNRGLAWIDGERVLSDIFELQVSGPEVSAYSRNGETMVTQTIDAEGNLDKLLVWDLSTGEPTPGTVLRPVFGPTGIHKSAISADGRWIFASGVSIQGAIQRWHKIGEKWVDQGVLTIGDADIKGIFPIDPARSGSRALVLSKDGDIDLVDLHQGIWIERFTKHKSILRTTSQSPSGDQIYLGSKTSGIIRLDELPDEVLNR